MILAPEWVRDFVSRLTDSHGYHFSIGKILATAIVKWAIANPLHPQFSDPDFTWVDEFYTAGLIATVTTYEGSNRVDVVGDHGKSICAMQVQKFYGYSREEILKDASKCVEVGLKILHEANDMCPDYPLAPYAQGSCEGKKGREISDIRVGLVNGLLKEINRVATSGDGE